MDTPLVPINQRKETEAGKPITPPANTNLISTLLKKIQDITGPHQQQPATTTPPSDTTLINRSPGISPSESMATLISDILTLPVDNPTKPVDNQQPIHEPTTQINNQPPIHDPPKQTDNRPPITDQPHAPIDIPVTPPVSVEPRKCPVCNHEFSATSEDVDMYDHIENCLFPTGIYTAPKDYTCPNCERKYPGNEEMAYQQHLADCYRDI